jgi:hypothetical protein
LYATGIACKEEPILAASTGFATSAAADIMYDSDATDSDYDIDMDFEPRNLATSSVLNVAPAGKI